MYPSREELERHEADVRQMLEEKFPGVELDEYLLDDLEVEDRHKRKSYPFKGQRVWLLPFSGSELNIGGSQIGAEKFDEGYETIITGLSKVLAGWTCWGWGRPRPQPYHNTQALRDMPDDAVWHFYQLDQRGESRAARGNGSSRGPRGDTTRAYSEPTTPS